MMPLNAPSAEKIALADSRILIVDDNEINLHFLKKILLNAGYRNLDFAANGEEALRRIGEIRPEIVVLDLMMPVMDGFDFCRAVRKNPRFASLPILVQTAATATAECLAAFDAGATDFVNKPIVAGELCARVKVHLERQALLGELERYRERIADELACAQALQESILPQRRSLDQLEQDYGIEIAAYAETSSEVGGDLWDTYPLYSRQLACMLADFSGHGIAASLNAFRLQAYLKQASPLAVKPGEYLGEINEKLLLHALRGQFATIFYGIIDVSGNQLIYACAGCPHPMILRKNGTIDLLDASGMPLGISLHDYPTRRASFNSGDMLIVYSDALIETPDSEGRFIEEDEWRAIIGENAGLPAREMLRLLLEKLQSHAAAPCSDDLTLTLYRRL